MLISQAYNYFDGVKISNSSINIVQIYWSIQISMSKTQIFVVVLLALTLMQGAQATFNFNVKKSFAYLNGGNCFVNPGVELPAPRKLGYQYYDLPAGWKQYNDLLVIPDVISRKGSWTFGCRANDETGASVNNQFKVVVNGLQIKISPLTGSDSTNLVIGSNFRSKGSDDTHYQNFVKKVGSWNGESAVQTTTSQTGSSSSTSTSSSSSTTTTSTSTSSSSSSSTIIKSNSTSIVSFIEALLKKTVKTQEWYWGTTPTPSSNTNTNKYTAEDKKKALDRQSAANQAVSELNTLISQLTANVQASSESIKTISSQVSEFTTSNTQCSNKILEFSNEKLRIETLIKTTQVTIEESNTRAEGLKPTLSSLQSTRDQLAQERARIESSRPNAENINKFEASFTACQVEVESFKLDYSKAQETITQITKEIEITRNNAADAPNQITLIADQIVSVDETIAELKARLQEAEDKKASLLEQKAKYEASIIEANNKVSTLQRRVTEVTSQLVTLQVNVDSKVVECTGYKTQTDNLRNEIAANQAEYDQINSQIDVQDGLISQKKGEIDQILNEITKITITLTTIQNDLENSKVSLERQYSLCTTTQTSLTRIQSDLDAANLKLETEKKFLTEAQAKLVAAQAEKKAADDLVAKILAESTPTPPKNNTGILGGISGIIRIIDVKNVLPQKIILGLAPIAVGNVCDYIDNLYGASYRSQWRESQSRASVVTTLYPISTTTLHALYGYNRAGVFINSGQKYLTGITNTQFGQGKVPSGVVGDFKCDSSATTTGVSGYGRVTSVQPGYITLVDASNNPINVRIGGCSRIEANKPEFVATVNTNVFYKGARNTKGEVNAHDITCVE